MKFFYLFLTLLSFNFLYSQTCSEYNLTAFSGDGTGIYVTANQYRTANDITVAPNIDFTLNQITANIVVQEGGSVDSVDIVYYDDNNGVPGSQIGSQNTLIPTSQNIAYNNGLDVLSVVLDVAPFNFPGTIDDSTTYWISIVATVSDTALVWWELSEACTIGNRICERNASSGIWYEKGYGDGVYEFSGTCSQTTGVACDPIAANPETFETADLTAHCWSLYQTEGDDPGFTQTNMQAHDGAASFYHASTDLGASSTSYLVSPAISVEYFDYLSFWYYQHNTADYGTSEVLISTNSSDPIANPSDFKHLVNLDETAIGGFSEDMWTKHTESLANYTGEVIYIAFAYTGDNSHELYIDDFSVLFEPLTYDEAATALHVNVTDEAVPCTIDNYVTGSNISATDSSAISGTPSCGAYAGGDIWFKFEAPDTGAVQLILPEFIMLGWSKFSYALYDKYDNTEEMTCNSIGYLLNLFPNDNDIFAYITGLEKGEMYYLRTWDDDNNDFGELEFCLKAYTDPNASILENSIDGFVAFPNPAKNKLSVQSDHVLKKIKVFDYLGKIVIDKQVNNKNVVLNIRQLKQGVYFLKAQTDSQAQSFKLIVE